MKRLNDTELGMVHGGNSFYEADMNITDYSHPFFEAYEAHTNVYPGADTGTIDWFPEIGTNH